MSVLKLQAVKALTLLLFWLGGCFATGVGKVNSFVMADKMEGRLDHTTDVLD